MESNRIKATVLQRALIWEDGIRNRSRFNRFIDGLPETDLILLPEMFTTGFVTEPKGVAESADGCTLAWMKRKSVERGCAIAGSIAVEENGRYYNRFYFVTPDPETEGGSRAVFYDKHHLFTYGGEDRRFTPGERRVVAEWKGMRFLLLVCYDLRFPVWGRNSLTEEGGRPEFDAILCVASWPTSRIEAWKTLLKARAIENQCFVLAANRVGDDPNCSYSGGSAIIDPYGRAVAECVEGREGVCSAVLDMEALGDFRRKFPVLQDADGLKRIV